MGIESIPWRVLRISGYWGPGMRFRYLGMTWEVQQIGDRDEGGTIVVVSPTTRAADHTPSEGSVTDFGEASQYGIGASEPSMSGPLPTTQSASQDAPQDAGVTQSQEPFADIWERLEAGGYEGPTSPEEAGGVVTQEMIDELTYRCASGDQQACLTLQSVRDARPDLFPDYEAPGTGSGSGDALAIAGLQEEGAMERLVLQLEQQARDRAEGTASQMSEQLAQALAAIGFAAPELFAGIKDPAQLQEALQRALEAGDVYPTLERQELIAEAAQSPSDVVRLLFLAGGAGGAPKHLQGKGAFNAFSVLDEGKRAREGLARQIAAAPRVTMEELVDRLMPPIAASKGAIIEMRRGQDGLYQAAGGASVVEGPELFTVGEKGTEFALLAPGSIIAPKISKGEPETRERAINAIKEMVRYGRRQGTKDLKAAQFGTSVFGDIGDLTSADQRGNVMDSLGDVGDLLGGALRGSGRSSTDRLRDLRMQYLPFEGVSAKERAKMFGELPANVKGLLQTPELRRMRESRYMHQVAKALGAQGAREGLKGNELVAYVLQKMRRTSLPANPSNAALWKAGVSSMVGGAPGTNLNLPALLEMPSDVRAATLTMLGSLIGSDVVASQFETAEQARTRAFDAGSSRLALSR